ncbi:30S ribosomal protein S9 [Candidatus Dependentiae bacterium]|nr:30S ribosomal protein S9 [Candidatus Dependentiae bacterium]
MAQASASTKKTAAKASSQVKSQSSSKSEIVNRPFAHAVGRRKSAVARAWLRKGNGQLMVNGLAHDEYFKVQEAVDASQASFKAFPVTSGMTADVTIKGGGYSAQSLAMQLAVARALLAFDETLKSELRKQGFITVDSRVKERKKYGQKAARRKFQFTKR